MPPTLKMCAASKSLTVVSVLAIGFALIIATAHIPNLKSTYRIASFHIQRQARSNGAVVIVHLGDGSYISGVPQQQTAQIVDNVQQLRLFNFDIPIYIVVSPELKMTAAEVAQLTDARAVLVTTDALPSTPHHKHWQQHSNWVNATQRNSFARYVSERFFYLSDVAVQYGLANIIHIEYDNLVYQDLGIIIPKLERLYEVAGVFDSPARCIPGFMYFRNAHGVTRLAQYMSQAAERQKNDMEVIGDYWKENPEAIGPLPIFNPSTYPDPVDIRFATNVAELGCIFDGAAYGQFVGGVDPRNTLGANSTGYINPTSVVKPDKARLQWRMQAGLLVPYVDGLPVVNLHIHSKNTTRFRSDRVSY